MAEMSEDYTARLQSVQLALSIAPPIAPGKGADVNTLVADAGTIYNYLLTPRPQPEVTVTVPNPENYDPNKDPKRNRSKS